MGDLHFKLKLAPLLLALAAAFGASSCADSSVPRVIAVESRATETTLPPNEVPLLKTPAAAQTEDPYALAELLEAPPDETPRFSPAATPRHDSTQTAKLPDLPPINATAQASLVDMQAGGAVHGMRYEDAVTLFGKPDELIESAGTNGAILACEALYESGDRFSFRLDADTGELVLEAATFLAPASIGPRGVRISDPLEDLLSAFSVRPPALSREEMARCPFARRALLLYGVPQSLKTGELAIGLPRAYVEANGGALRVCYEFPMYSSGATQTSDRFAAIRFEIADGKVASMGFAVCHESPIRF